MLRSVFTVTVVSKASWVVMDTMNNRTYNPMESDNRLGKALYRSCLGTKDTTQRLLDTLVSPLKKCCYHKKCCECVGCAAV